MEEEEYRLEFEKAIETLKPAILEAAEEYPTDVVVSALIEVGMRLSLLKYGAMGLVGLLADILHTTATSGKMIDEMQKKASKSDQDVMTEFKNAGKDTKS
tara:strand:- start:292 stop:591 length:300 start_codon:yes stop_codon:yes gene_type:complete